MPSHCKSKYCGALVVMLRSTLDVTTSDIVAYTGIPTSSVVNITNRKCPELKKRRCQRLSDGVLHAVESDYLNGLTTFEIGKKYGISHAGVSKLMNKRGHTRGRDWYKGGLRDCAVCGKQFEPKAHNSKCCSKRCHNLYHGANSKGYRRRARKYGVEHDPTITLEAVFIRDGGVCQICGDRCDYESVSANGKGVGHLYPTIDHINPLKNGGSHTWDNVQLAHHFCNSKKREHELTEDFKQVISHAKEQAIGNQCA